MVAGDGGRGKLSFYNYISYDKRRQISRYRPICYYNGGQQGGRISSPSLLASTC